MNYSPFIPVFAILAASIFLLALLGFYLYRVHKSKAILRAHVVELAHVVDSHNRCIQTVWARENAQLINPEDLGLQHGPSGSSLVQDLAPANSLPTLPGRAYVPDEPLMVTLSPSTYSPVRGSPSNTHGPAITRHQAPVEDMSVTWPRTTRPRPRPIYIPHGDTLFSFASSRS